MKCVGSSFHHQSQRRNSNCCCCSTVMRLLLLVASCLVTVAVTAATTISSSEKEQALLKWVESNGGYYSPKQQLSSRNGLHGVFAVSAISKDEVLASIPWSCIIYAEDYRMDSCETVKLLADELDKNEDDESSFSAYASILKNTAKEHAQLLPAHWSPQGQALLSLVTGNGVLPPYDPFLQDFSWKHSCEQIHKDATLLVMTHGEDFGMVPLTDKYNSRGGNYTGAYFSLSDGSGKIGLEVRALRDIQVGEEIYTDYRDYGQVGTPELLRDYGFVEFYPQRFIFPSERIAFDVEQTDDGTFQIKWKRRISSTIYQGRPFNKRANAFLQEQLARLQQDVYPKLQSIVEKNEKNIPSHEMQTVVKFCQDYMSAMALAIQDVSTEELRTNPYPIYS